ncbi:MULTISPECIES: protein-L-isoaspartate(D-aspartate) O-methyltransferase [Nitratiruptor]|uniref:Protein-L-isoaspartate O-methyltransferase n=1 Tax=Nitratiruptor tergarcus DSM 16512 TaxID=1069081 RepID=A0A1W1WQY9_9BACT|nr:MULTISPECIES: protein-L-isoaspartate(D-aspartate) O-methyltransferase [Nitratiruptor]BCD61196.1 protein-L-isoaspartate(D-aspartate) O-methyltransferase [Nitratiruptor sp. YY08-13]BCD65129.1 protein-L-isoaspartate(D-aspartate) O-methyltransferase [Nitratiruptor sp. YY08-26]SMC08707.1 protein-L-isoaspartate(D-aspartate) O-methyltransferase [Nitratiruptor tergarcus DSM 16512]
MNLQERIELQKCQKMAENINKIFPLHPKIKEAFAKVRRELFVPVGFTHHAYKLDALPIAGNQWISSPLTVAKMTQFLEPVGADSILEIGCGSGYQAAILSKIVRRVFTVERIERLVIEAKQRFKELDITNVHVRYADGMLGWREFAPYDRIIFSAALTKVPQNIFEQLSDGGIIVAPIIQKDKQIITRFFKDGNVEELDTCYFINSKSGVE